MERLKNTPKGRIGVTGCGVSRYESGANAYKKCYRIFSLSSNAICAAAHVEKYLTADLCARRLAGRHSLTRRRVHVSV